MKEVTIISNRVANLTLQNQGDILSKLVGKHSYNQLLGRRDSRILQRSNTGIKQQQHKIHSNIQLETSMRKWDKKNRE